MYPSEPPYPPLSRCHVLPSSLAKGLIYASAWSEAQTERPLGQSTNNDTMYQIHTHTYKYVHIYPVCTYTYGYAGTCWNAIWMCCRRRRSRFHFTKGILHTIFYLQLPARPRRCPVNATRPAQGAAAQPAEQERQEELVLEVPEVAQLEQQLQQITLNSSRAQRTANWAPMRQ